MHLIRALAARPRPVLLSCLLLVAILAGCSHDPTGNGNDDPTGTPPEPTSPLWNNPYNFTLHFDGERAYQDLLAQIYEDPENHAGPRYRVPGTQAHEEVAQEIYAKLQEPMDTMGGQVSFSNFTGEDYYALDLAPVSRFLCNEGSEQGQQARERVRGLSFMNVVARTNETHHGFILAAHWDSKRFADQDDEHPDERVLGADDGASGTAAVVELARAFAASEVDIPLTFLLLDGEDGFEQPDCHPLAGSLHYAQSLSDEQQETVDGMILLDMVGNESARFHREGHSQCYPFPECDIDSSWLINHLWATAASMDVEAFVNRTTGAIHDDHIPFLHQGIHSIDIIRYENRFPPYWHTTDDDHTAVQPEGLEQVGVVLEAALRRYSEDPSRIGPSEVGG